MPTQGPISIGISLLLTNNFLVILAALLTVWAHRARSVSEFHELGYLCRRGVGYDPSRNRDSLGALGVDANASSKPFLLRFLEYQGSRTASTVPGMGRTTQIRSPPHPRPLSLAKVKNLTT